MSTINPFSWSSVGVSIINAVAFSFSRCCLVWLINSNEVISDYLILLEQKFFFLGHLSFIRKKTHTAVTKFLNKLKFQAVKIWSTQKKLKQLLTIHSSVCHRSILLVVIYIWNLNCLKECWRGESQAPGFESSWFAPDFTFNYQTLWLEIIVVNFFLVFDYETRFSLTVAIKSMSNFVSNHNAYTTIANSAERY